MTSAAAHRDTDVHVERLADHDLLDVGQLELDVLPLALRVVEVLLGAGSPAHGVKHGQTLCSRALGVLGDQDSDMSHRNTGTDHSRVLA